MQELVEAGKELPSLLSPTSVTSIKTEWNMVDDEEKSADGKVFGVLQINMANPSVFLTRMHKEN